MSDKTIACNTETDLELDHGQEELTADIRGMFGACHIFSHYGFGDKTAADADAMLFLSGFEQLQHADTACTSAHSDGQCRSHKEPIPLLHGRRGV